MIKLSELIKIIKSFARNRAISDEEILNAYLLPFVIAGNIKNRNKEEFHLDKSRTSRIMNQREDVATKLREALSIYGIRDATIAEMGDFIEDYIDPSKCKILAEKLNEFLPKKNTITGSEAYIEDKLSEILTDLLMGSLGECNISSTEARLIWKHGIGSVEIQTGDLFRFGFGNRGKKKNIVVIPVNTAFDTQLSSKLENSVYPLVSENTIHGQWLVRMKESGEDLEQLKTRMANSLRHNGFFSIDGEKKERRRNVCYPIASVAIIETKNAAYFLVAISQFDKFNNARSTSEDIDTAIQSVLKIYDRVGMGYDLYLPLMGTGLSRAGLDFQEAYDLITNCLIRNGNRIHGHVHLVLRPEDREKIKRSE